VRNFISTILLVFLLLGLNSPSVAAPLSTDKPVVVTAAGPDDFCGNAPPASVSCPQTGLNECKCYLSSTQGSTESETFEETKSSPKPPTRGKTAVILTETPYAGPVIYSIPSLLERPPRI
jgi:hypothetical protein